MNAGRPAALLAETERLAERILAVAPPPERPPPAEGGWNFVTKGEFLVDPTDLFNEMHAMLMVEGRIQAFFLAYSVQWFRPRRKVKAVPTHPEFLTYRDLVRKRAIDLVTECDQRSSRVVDKVGDGAVAFPVTEPEVRVAHLLTLADQRRMDAEQDDATHLVHGVLGQVSSDERADVARKVLTLLYSHWQERGAESPAMIDALAGKK